MNILPIVELGPVVVVNSGIPGQERVVFRPTETINLAQCGLLVGWRGETGTIPLPDQFFWFGDVTITPPCWVNVFTGKGTNTQVPHAKTKQPCYLFYWGRELTVFNVLEVVPILFKMEGIMIGNHGNPLPKPFAQHQLERKQALELPKL